MRLIEGMLYSVVPRFTLWLENLHPPGGLPMTTRRSFLKSATLAGTGCLVSGTGFWPGGAAAAQARGPNERLHIGIIGAGGRGAGNVVMP
jgi:hypothetical protein